MLIERRRRKRWIIVVVCASVNKNSVLCSFFSSFSSSFLSFVFLEKMQNTRWLTRNTLCCWWWWWWRKQKRRRTTARKNHLFFKKRGKRRGVKKKVWSSFCGCFAVRCEARGDCLARWWCSVSMMTHERWEILKDKINFSQLFFFFFFLWRRKRKRKTKRWNEDVPLLGSRITQNTTLLPCVCMY